MFFGRTEGHTHTHTQSKMEQWLSGGVQWKRCWKVTLTALSVTGAWETSTVGWYRSCWEDRRSLNGTLATLLPLLNPRTVYRFMIVPCATSCRRSWNWHIIEIHTCTCCSGNNYHIPARMTLVQIPELASMCPLASFHRQRHAARLTSDSTLPIGVFSGLLDQWQLG